MTDRTIHDDYRTRRIEGDHLIETCLRCDREQPIVWEAGPGLWAMVADFDPPERGVLCPECFDDLAREQGLGLRWHPRVAWVRQP